MRIEEINIDYLDNKAVNCKKWKYPITDNNLPNPYTMCISCGSRGSGKTHSVVKLLQFYQEFGYKDGNTGEITPQRIILLSPTANANEIFFTLKYLNETDIYTEFNESTLDNIIEEIKDINKKIEEYRFYCDAYMKFKKASMKELDQLTAEELEILFQNDFKHPNDIEKQPPYKNYPINHIILDDCLGSEFFSQKRKNSLVKYVLNSRHLRCQFFIMAQSLRSVNKPIRLNASLIILFKFANKKVVCEDLYETISNVLTPEQFEKLYDYCTQEQHGCLIVDSSKKKDHGMFKKGFDKILRIKSTNIIKEDDEPIRIVKGSPDLS